MSKTTPEQPNPDYERIKRITGKIEQAWHTKPNLDYFKLMDLILGIYNYDNTDPYLMDDEYFEILLNRFITQGEI